MDSLIVEETARVERGVAAPRKGVVPHPEGAGSGLEVRQYNAHPHDRGRAYGPCVQKLLRLDEGWVVEEVLGHPEDRVSAGGGLGDAVGLLDRASDGLLAGDVLACLQSGYRLFGVKVGWSEQLYGIDVRVFQDLLVACVYLGIDSPLDRPALGPLAHRVAEGYYVTRFVLQVARRVELGYGPAPNYG